MKVNLSKYSNFLFLCSLAGLATACEKPALIHTVSFSTDSNVTAEVTIEGRDVATGYPKKEKIQISNGSAAFNPLVAEKITVDVNYASRANLPEHALPRKATIRTDVKLSGDDKFNLKDAKVIQKSSKTLLTHTIQELGPDKTEEIETDIDCSGKLTAKAAGETVRLTFSNFQGLTASCAGRDLLMSNPDRIGSRDVTLEKNGKVRNKYTMAEDISLGQEFVAEFNSMNAQAILPSDHPTTQYVQRLMDRIAAAADQPTTDPKLQIKPSVYVINADVLNAFALPGGYVYVFRGLLDQSRSEAEIVGVLAHEWAHAAARHGTRNVTRARSVLIKAIVAYIAANAVAVAGDLSDREYLSISGRVAAPLIETGAILHLLHKSREAESEADRLGAQYAYKAGWAPWGLADMFQVFLSKSGYETKLEEAFSDHPAMNKRIAMVHDLSALFFAPAGPYSLNSSEYTSAKAALAYLPAPSKADSIRYGNAFAETVNAVAGRRLEKFALSQKKWVVASIAAGGILGGLLKKETDEEEKND